MSTAMNRLRRDYTELLNDPLPNVRAAPLPSNMLRWHFVFVGDENTDFEGGYYFGTITFAKEYPFKPPAYRLLTSNGRMTVGQEVCISTSNYHAEKWNPLWTVSGLLTGFVAFFHDLTQVHFAGSVGGQKTTEYKMCAKNSKQAVLRIPEMNELFSDVVQQIQHELNDAAPIHRLPNPPEYEQIQRAAADRKKIEAAEKATELSYDDMYDDLDGDDITVDEEIDGSV